MKKVLPYLSNRIAPLSMVCCTVMLLLVTHQAQAQCTDTPMLTSNGTTVSATGTSGICLLCSISNSSNIVNASTADYGTVSIPVGVLASGYVRLKLPQTYPAGTRVGWIADVNGGIAGLFNGVTLRAYMNGTLVGSVSGGSLFNILGFGGGKNINGVFCNPFNEVEITMGSLAGVLASYNIYYAYVTTGCTFPVQCGSVAGTEICGDNIDNDGDGLVDNEDICINPCVAGSAAPALNATTKSNICPSNTVNLTTLTASNQPSNTTLSWHTGTPATTANKITGTAVTTGTYYATFFDATNNCFSNNGAATTIVTATVTACCPFGSIAPILKQ